jgi:Membrane proteins related to metalloendopeptidases
VERKNGFLKNLERFFAGKGFYIVLFLCMAVIGVSAWAMLTGTGSDVDDVSNISAYDGYIPTAGPLIPPADNPARVPDDPQEGITSDSPDTSEAPVQQLVPQEPDIQTNTVNEPQDADSPVMAETNFSPSFIWPLAGEIETPYSETALLYNKTMADWRTHDGIDVAAELGAQVMTVSSGRVERIYTDDLYGITVVINHGDSLRSIYSNLAETPTVYENSSVTTGEIIGAIGTSALAEAGEVGHLHLKMTLDGLNVDPALYLPNR